MKALHLFSALFYSFVSSQQVNIFPAQQSAAYTAAQANPYGSAGAAPYAGAPFSSSANPYASVAASANPYQTTARQANPYQTTAQQANPYQTTAQQANPYQTITQQANPYQTTVLPQQQQPNSFQQPSNQYATQQQQQPQAQISERQLAAPQSSASLSSYELAIAAATATGALLSPGQQQRGAPLSPLLNPNPLGQSLLNPLSSLANLMNPYNPSARTRKGKLIQQQQQRRPQQLQQPQLIQPQPPQQPQQQPQQQSSNQPQQQSSNQPPPPQQQPQPQQQQPQQSSNQPQQQQPQPQQQSSNQPQQPQPQSSNQQQPQLSNQQLPNQQQPSQQLQPFQTQQQQQARVPTVQPQRPPVTAPTPLSRLPFISPTNLPTTARSIVNAVSPTSQSLQVQPSYGPPVVQAVSSRAPIAVVGARAPTPANPTSLYPSAPTTASLYGVVSPTPAVATGNVDAACLGCVCDQWWKCCDIVWNGFCDGLTATVCSAECTGSYSGSQKLPTIRNYPASVGEFCGRGLFMRPVECDAAMGLQCLATSNNLATKNEIGQCYQVTPPPPAPPNACTDNTARCSCTVEKCGGTRGWNGVQGVCQAGEETSAFEMLNCQTTPAMCSQVSDRCECAFSSCWGWTSQTSQCLISPQCVDRRTELANEAVLGFKRRNIQVLAWDFDSTIISVDTASGCYPDLAYVTDRMDQDFIALAKAAQRAGMKQAITSYNSIGMVFVDGQLTGGPGLLKAVLAKVLGEDNGFLIFAFESKTPDVEGKNVHLQMLMQQLGITHKSTVLLIDDYEVNVKLAKTAGYSTAKARTGRGVDLRMLAS